MVLCDEREEEEGLLADIFGSGEGGLVEVVDEGSSSGSFVERRAGTGVELEEPKGWLRAGWVGFDGR